MKKIFITGSTGLLGSTLTPFFIMKGYIVHTQSLQSKSEFQCDLINESCTHNILNKVQPDVIINLVALTDVEECERNPTKAYLVNVRTVENIVSWIKMNQHAILIHISTDHVYDGHGHQKEEEIFITNVYALSKYCAELVALKVNCVVLRTNFFGNSKNPKRKSFSDWLIKVLMEKKPVTLYSDVYFSPLSLTSLQQMISLVIESPIFGIYNLGSHEGMSKRDFSHALAVHLGLSTSSAIDGLSTSVSNQTYRPKNMCMDVSLFEKTYDAKLPTLLEEIQTLIKPSYDAISKECNHDK